MGGWSDGVDMFSVCWLSAHPVHISFIEGGGKLLQDKPRTCYPEETQECSSHFRPPSPSVNKHKRCRHNNTPYWLTICICKQYLRDLMHTNMALICLKQSQSIKSMKNAVGYSSHKSLWLLATTIDNIF